MDEWEKFNETSLPEKEEIYNSLNMEEIIDANYMHAKIICKDFEIKSLGEYQDLHLKSDTLLLADVFENFRKVCLKMYNLDLAKLLSIPRIAWQAALKGTKVELELLTNTDMLLMAEKEIGGAICHANSSIYKS